MPTALLESKIEALKKKVEGGLRELVHLVEEKMASRFEAMDARFEALQREINTRFASIQREMVARFEAVDVRFESLNKRLNFLMWFIGIVFLITNFLIVLIRLGQ